MASPCRYAACLEERAEQGRGSKLTRTSKSVTQRRLPQLSETLHSLKPPMSSCSTGKNAAQRTEKDAVKLKDADSSELSSQPIPARKNGRFWAVIGGVLLSTFFAVLEAVRHTYTLTWTHPQSLMTVLRVDCPASHRIRPPFRPVRLGRQRVCHRQYGSFAAQRGTGRRMSPVSFRYQLLQRCLR